METRQRTIVKAVVWNAMGLMMMGFVGFVMTGSATVGGTIAVINTLIGLTFYIFYERAWAHVRWGRSYD